MKIKLTTDMAGATNRAAGEVHDYPEAEAIRIIEAGFAVPVEEKRTEKAVKKGPQEKR